MLKTLLIDDEEQARYYLRKMLEAHPEVEIVGEADALPAARALLARKDYDFVFLDIKLGNHTGFELLPHVAPDRPVVFVTGYEEHAQRAFEVNAADYLMKPVAPDRLAESIRRVSERRRPPAPTPIPRPVAVAPEIAANPPTLRPGDTVLLNSGDRVQFALVSEISLIEANQNYSRVHLADGRQILVRRSIKSWTDSLPPELFLRAHRTALVNRMHVTGYSHETPRKIALQIAGVAQRVSASRVATPVLKTRLLTPLPSATYHVVHAN